MLRAFLMLLILLPSLAYAATGDILSVEISPTGASPFGACADIEIEGFTTGKAVDFGSGYGAELDYDDIADATIVFTVVSEGYNSSGTLGTVSRTVYATSVVRQEYPNHADDEEPSATKIRVALSEPIYDDDNTGAGNSGTAPTVTIAAAAIRNDGGSSETSAAASNQTCTNSSTLDYPKVIGRWDRIAGVHTGDLVTASFRMAARCYAKFGIARVDFDADGQSSSNNEGETVTTRTAVQRAGSGLYAESYRTGLIALDDFTDNELVDLRFRAYPVVGDADSIIDTDGHTTAADEPLGINEAVIVVDPDNDYALYASVDIASGNDATGVTSGTLSTAEASPYQHIGDAIEDGATRIYLEDGTHPFLGHSWTRVTPSIAVVVSPHPTNSSTSGAIVQIDGTNQTYDCSRLEYKDVTLRLADTASYPYGEDVNVIRFNGCVFDDDTTGAGVVSFGYRSLVTYIDNCTGDMGEQEWRFDLWSSDYVAFCFDGNDFGNPGTPRTHAIAAWEFCANKVKRKAAVIGASDVSGSPTRNNFIFDFNEILSYDGEGTTAVAPDSEATDKDRIALVGNIFESISTTSTALLVLGEAVNHDVSNVILWHNTWAGERENLAYDAGGTGAPHQYDNWDVRFNAFADMHVKGDVFYTSGTATGGWPVIYKVGWLHNHDLDYLTNTSGGQDWLVLGLGGTTGSVGYTDDNSGDGDGTGNGDYTPAGGSALLARIPTGARVITSDLYGNPVVENGDIGAIQVTTAATGHPWFYWRFRA